MTQRQLPNATAADTAHEGRSALERLSAAGRARRWRGVLVKAAAIVLLVSGVPALISAIYLSSGKGQLLLACAAALAVLGLLIVVWGHLHPSAGGPSLSVRATPRDQETEHRDLARAAAERSHWLAAVAEVAHAATSVLDPPVLLPQVIELVRDRLGLYYVGLFLVDRERRSATLEAGTGAAGRQMVAAGHRVEVGDNSTIGQCVATGKPAVQPDAGAATVGLCYPLLPEARSELVLPLRARGRVVGALVALSERADAFDQAAVGLLQTMADQVAVAIDNAQLFAQSQAALREMAAIQQRYILRGWREYLAAETASAAVTWGSDQLEEDTIAAEIRAVLANGATTVVPAPSLGDHPAGGRGHTALVLPITVRDRTIGVLGVHDDAHRGWSEPDIALAEAIVERLGMAAESLRLRDETQRRAAREQLTARIGQQVREAPDLREIMRIAAEALGQELGASEVVLRLGTTERLLGS